MKTRFMKIVKVQTTNGAWNNDNGKNSKKIGKNIANKIIKLQKVHAMMALKKTQKKKPQKVARFCKMSRLKFFDLKFKPLGLLISS